MPRTDELIDQVKNLPPAPVILTQLLQLLDTAEADADRVVGLIACDPSLTAHVMRLCNSAYLGSAKPADSLLEAVLRIGFNEVYQMVVAIVGGRAMQRSQKGYGINAGELWRHSVVTALCAKLMARARQESENVIFTAAILHDIGKIVLAQALEKRYASLVEEIQLGQQSLLETESKLLGANHAEVGARLLERWRFPTHLVNAVAWHHQPAGAGEHQRIAAFLYLANMIAYFMGFGYGYQAFAMRGRAEALDILELTPADLPRYMIAAFESLDAVERLLSIKP